MLERIRTGDYRTTPYEPRRPEPRTLDRDHFVPLFLSDGDGEPQPGEYITEPQIRRGGAFITSRILAVVCMAAAVAVVFALFSSDAMRDVVNIKASMASIFPAPSVAATSPALLPPSRPVKDPARVSDPANKTAVAPAIRTASLTPSRDDMRDAYRNALQNQAPAAPSSAAPVAVTEPPPPAGPPHRLNANDVAASMKRAGGLIASGDIAAARLVLQQVADDGDAQAAVTLAETYDPTILEKLSVHGTVPDVALARRWYEAAQKYGSAEATQRLAVLATASH
jgi:hypothetical protein